MHGTTNILKKNEKKPNEKIKKQGDAKVGKLTNDSMILWTAILETQEQNKDTNVDDEEENAHDVDRIEKYN